MTARTIKWGRIGLEAAEIGVDLAKAGIRKAKLTDDQKDLALIGLDYTDELLDKFADADPNNGKQALDLAFEVLSTARFLALYDRIVARLSGRVANEDLRKTVGSLFVQIRSAFALLGDANPANDEQLKALLLEYAKGSQSTDDLLNAVRALLAKNPNQDFVDSAMRILKFVIDGIKN